jgi:hypothetical protein
MCKNSVKFFKKWQNMKKQEIGKKKIRWSPLVPRKKSNTRAKKRSLGDKKHT